MIYKIKKYFPEGVDRRQLLDEGYAQAHIAGTSAEAYAKQDFWPLLQQYVAKEKIYLDAGCGVGGWVLFLHDEGFSVQGVDENARILRAMTEYNPDVQVKQGSLTALPYATSLFDGVVAIGSLDHVEHDLSQALSELKRVVKPGGLVFIEVPLFNSLRKFLYVPLKRLEAVVRRSLGHKEVFAGYLFDEAGIRELLQKHGFETIKAQAHDLPAGEGHYGLYVDWPILRGSKPYQLNIIGNLVLSVCKAISPWVAATGIFVVARKD